jgi:hypothetical protein
MTNLVGQFQYRGYKMWAGYLSQGLFRMEYFVDHYKWLPVETEPELERACKIWSESGYADMELSEFLTKMGFDCGPIS